MNRPAGAPRLTLVLCSRNDDYMGNSRWRLQMALNWLGERVHAIGRASEVEVIVTDWGSDTPLREVLQLTERAARLVSFLEVPSVIARREQRDSPFPEVLALNAAARRARGDYIGRIDQDMLVGEGFLRFFFDAREGRVDLDIPLDRGVFFANRRGIPYRFVQQQPSAAHLDRFVARFGRTLQVFDDSPWYPGIFWASFVGIVLLHRSLWHEAGGYDESLIYMNHMEIELVARLRQRLPVVDLGALVDHDFYHLDHYPPGSWWAGDHRRVNELPDIDSAAVRPLHPNGTDWGLRHLRLETAPFPPARAVAPERHDWRPFGLLVAAAGVRLAWDHRLDADHLRRIRDAVATSLSRARTRSVRTWGGTAARRAASTARDRVTSGLVRTANRAGLSWRRAR